MTWRGRTYLLGPLLTLPGFGGWFAYGVAARWRIAWALLRARDREQRFALFVSVDVDLPGAAADFAVLDHGAAGFGVDGDLDPL